MFERSGAHGCAVLWVNHAYVLYKLEWQQEALIADALMQLRDAGDWLPSWSKHCWGGNRGQVALNLSLLSCHRLAGNT